MEHLAEYVIKNQKWYDNYVSTNTLKGTRNRSFMWSVNWGTLIVVAFSMLLFQDYMLETLGYLGNIYIPRYYIPVFFCLSIWIINGYLGHLSTKHISDLIKTWWLTNLNRKDEWNSLDYQIMKNRGYV